MATPLDLDIQRELHHLIDQYFELDAEAFLPKWTALQARLQVQTDALSEETLHLARDIAYCIHQTASAYIEVAQKAERCRTALHDETAAYMGEAQERGLLFSEDEDEDELEEEGPDTDWEALREWFLSHLAHPYPTPSQCRQLTKECHINGEELEDWFNYMRELTHWDDIYSSWAQGNPVIMKDLIKVAGKELDLEIPGYRCRTTPIQRFELVRLRERVHEIYKPGPAEWWADLEFEPDNDSEDSDDGAYSDDGHQGPPSDGDTQELVVLDPDCGLDTFFDAAERPITASIHPSILSRVSATIPCTSKGVPALLPISAVQRESLEWLDKLDRVEAETNAAYAEVERITIKLENGGDETVAVKLEAAEVRFEEAQKNEEEVATAALRRVQALQAQVKREGRTTCCANEPVIKKEEAIEPTVSLEANGEPSVKPEVLEKLVPTTKIKIKLDPEVLESVHSPFTIKTESEVETIPNPPKTEPSDHIKTEIKLEIKAEYDVVRTDPDVKVEVKEEPDVERKSEPQFTLNTDPGAVAAKLEIKEAAVKIEPNVKLELPNEPPSPLILPKSEPGAIVFGTFQLLEPEEIQDLIASFAPLEVTLIQLDPNVIVVPPGLNNLFKPDSCTLNELEEEPEVIVKAEPAEVELNDELVTVPISFSLEEVISQLATSSMFPQVQITLDPLASPANPVSKSSISPLVPATPRRTRGIPRRTSPRLAALSHTPLRSASVSSVSSAPRSCSGSSAYSSDSEFGDSTTPTSSRIEKRSRPLPPSRRTKASAPQLSPTSPSQRKRKRGREEEPSLYDPSNPSASRPMKRARGLKRDPEEEEKEAHAALHADFVPPPLPKVSMVSESRKAKRKRQEEEEELRVIKRARVLCHVNGTQEDSLERPGHSMAALVLDPALAPQPSPKLEKVSGLPVVKSAYMSLEEIEKKLRVTVEDGPHPIDIVEEIRNLSLEALALMTDREFSALICSPESWELKYLEYEPNDDLFEDPPTPPPEPTKVLLAPPSPPMSAVVALPPAEGVNPGAQPEAEKAAESCSAAPAEEIVVKQEPVEPILGLALAPVLPSIVETVVETTPERIPDAPSLAAPVSDARDGNGCEAPSLTCNSPSTRPRSPKPTPAPLVRRTRIKRAVGMMDTLSLSGERVTPLLKDPFDLFKEVEEEDWRVEREQYYFPSRSHKNDGRRVPRVREFEGAWMPFMDYRQNVRYHPYGGGQRENSGRDAQQ